MADRWAIICYLRALQRSQNATAADVPPEHRAELEKPAETEARADTGGSKEMSERSHVMPAPEGEYFENEPLRRLVARCSRSIARRRSRA